MDVESTGRGEPQVSIRLAGEGEIETALAIDDDAWTMFTDRDKTFEFSPVEHAEGAAEDAKRWRAAARRGELFFGCDSTGKPVGMLRSAWSTIGRT